MMLVFAFCSTMAILPSKPPSARPETLMPGLHGVKFEALQAKHEGLLLEHKTLVAEHEALGSKYEAAQAKNGKLEKLQAKYEALLLEHKTLLAGRGDGDAAPGRALTPYARFKQLRNHLLFGKCGPNKHFPLEPENIPPPLLELLAHDVVQPNGCNACPKKGEVALWVAPGDLCKLQAGGMLENHGPLSHCAIGSEYRDDFEPSHHVKACLPEADLKYLWNTIPPHCHNDTVPFIRKEGLLFCAAGDGAAVCTDCLDSLYSCLDNLYPSV